MRGKKDHWFIITARVALGSLFLLAGVDAFFDLLPFPIAPPSLLESFRENNSYFLPTLKSVEILAGTLLLFNFFVPLSLIILAPIIINILLYSLFENSTNLPMAFVIIFCSSVLSYHYRKIFYLFFKPQLYSDPWRDETSQVLILEEVEEKLPRKVNQLKEILAELKKASA